MTRWTLNRHLEHVGRFILSMVNSSKSMARHIIYFSMFLILGMRIIHECRLKSNREKEQLFYSCYNCLSCYLCYLICSYQRRLHTDVRRRRAVHDRAGSGRRLDQSATHLAADRGLRADLVHRMSPVQHLATSPRLLKGNCTTWNRSKEIINDA